MSGKHEMPKQSRFGRNKREKRRIEPKQREMQYRNERPRNMSGKNMKNRKSRRGLKIFGRKVLVL